MISKELSFKSYKEICSGEKKKVNLGYWGDWRTSTGWNFVVENNSLVPVRRALEYYIYVVVPGVEIS